MHITRWRKSRRREEQKKKKKKKRGKRVREERGKGRDTRACQEDREPSGQTVSSRFQHSKTSTTTRITAQQQTHTTESNKQVTHPGNKLLGRTVSRGRGEGVVLWHSVCAGRIKRSASLIFRTTFHYFVGGSCLPSMDNNWNSIRFFCRKSQFMYRVFIIHKVVRKWSITLVCEKHWTRPYIGSWAFFILLHRLPIHQRNIVLQIYSMTYQSCLYLVLPSFHICLIQLYCLKWQLSQCNASFYYSVSISTQVQGLLFFWRTSVCVFIGWYNRLESLYFSYIIICWPGKREMTSWLNLDSWEQDRTCCSPGM